ncbi:MAG: hypothetical protein ACLU37_06725 [Collinsella sp.]
MPVRKLTSEQRLSRAIDIMEALYAAGENGMTRDELCSRFDITGASLDEILEIVSTLADRESGARIICDRRGGCVVLTGDAGRVLPLRLSAAEGAVLNHELESLGIEPQTAARIRPPFYPKSSANQRVFDTVTTVALAAAELCHSGRRSLPHLIARWTMHGHASVWSTLAHYANGDQTYLIAWDITVDEQRTYRMDKIEGLALTEDSVVPHHRTSHPSTIPSARTQRSAKL